MARNGRQFLTQLMNREQRNFQFDFLRPQHSLFQYFTKLLEQYTKVLIPPKSMQQRLRDEAKSAQAVLDQVKYRAEWQRYQEMQRAKEEEILERERGKFNCNLFFPISFNIKNLIKIKLLKEKLCPVTIILLIYRFWQIQK